MKTSHCFSFLILSSLVFFSTGCDKDKTAEKEKAVHEKPMPDIAGLVDGGALMAADDAAGGPENNEGVGHFKEGHWKTSGKHFREAIAAGPDLAEAHYNLALTLDKLVKHEEATNHFRKALELAPDNPKIKDSKILKEHLGM